MGAAKQMSIIMSYKWQNYDGKQQCGFIKFIGQFYRNSVQTRAMILVPQCDIYLGVQLFHKKTEQHTVH